jgi:hypothetical protein
VTEIARQRRIMQVKHNLRNAHAAGKAGLDYGEGP